MKKVKFSNLRLKSSDKNHNMKGIYRKLLHLYEHFTRSLRDFKRRIRQTLMILLNEITGFTHVKSRNHWELILKMVFRQNLLYFASLIMSMDGLYLGNDFRALFSKFLVLLLLLFCCCCRCCFWFHYFIIITIFIIIIIIIICGTQGRKNETHARVVGLPCT